MYERPKAYTPEDRVLRWTASWISRFKNGIPTDRFVRHLKGDLTGINFGQLDAALRKLEGEGSIRREWDTPGEYRVFLTEAGAQRAKFLEDRAARTPPASPVTDVSRAPPPFATPPLASPIPSPPSSFLPPSPTAENPPVSAPTPVVAPPIAVSVPPAAPAGSASANLPVRILLYCLLYGSGKTEAGSTVPSEDLQRYLISQGILLPEHYLSGLFDGLQKRDLIEHAVRPAGGYDLRLTPRGRHLAEGLLSGHVSMRPAGTVEPSMTASPTTAGPPPTDYGTTAATGSASGADALEDRWNAAEAENADLRRQVEELKAALTDSEEKRKQDRETLDEVMHQLELQDAKITELQAALQRANPRGPGGAVIR